MEKRKGSRSQSNEYGPLRLIIFIHQPLRKTEGYEDKESQEMDCM